MSPAGAAGTAAAGATGATGGDGGAIGGGGGARGVGGGSGATTGGGARTGGGDGLRRGRGGGLRLGRGGRGDRGDREPDLERRAVGRLHAHLGHRLDADRRTRGEDDRLALLLLDQAGEAGVDVLPARVDLLDLLQDRHGLRREALVRVLVREGQKQGDGFLLLVRQDEHVGELHPQARVGATSLELGLQDLDRAGILLLRDEGDDVFFLRLSPEADGQRVSSAGGP